MNEEDKKIQKHLVGEMMKVSKTNPDVMSYMQALMEKYEQLENNRNKAIEILESIPINADGGEILEVERKVLHILKGDDWY